MERFKIQRAKVDWKKWKKYKKNKKKTMGRQDINNINEKRAWVQKFNALCHIHNISAENRLALLSSFGVVSSKDLTIEQLKEACNCVKGITSAVDALMDKSRKKLIAAICQFLELTQDDNYMQKDGKGKAAYAIGVACRAAQVEDINSISLTKLRSLTYSFNKQKKVYEDVVQEAMSIVSGEE